MALSLYWLLHGGTGLAGSDVAPGGTSSDRAASTDLEGLMHRLASSGGVRAGFRETKHLSLLSAPLETEGVLYFAPPDLLARHTSRPGRSSVVIRGDRVELRDETGRQVIDLGSSGVARQYVDNLGVLLRGDLAALRSRYSIGFETDGVAWQLRLEPRSRAMRHIVAWIRVEGRGAELSSMETREASGDTTVSIFFGVETGLDFTASERERIFSLDYDAGAS